MVSLTSFAYQPRIPMESAGVLSESALVRQLPLELREIHEALCRGDRSLFQLQAVQEWLKKYEEYSDRTKPLRRQNPEEVQSLFVELLEKILKDPSNEARFSPSLFSLEAEPFFGALVKKMTTPHSLFFSPRLVEARERDLTERRITSELQEIEEELLQSHPSSFQAQCVARWLQVYREERARNCRLEPLVVQRSALIALENLLRDPWDEEGRIPLTIFSSEIPLFGFLAKKMTDPHSLFFSELIADAKRCELEERVRRIERAALQQAQQELDGEIEGLDRLQGFLERIEQNSIVEEGQLKDIHEDAAAKTTFLLNQVSEAREKMRISDELVEQSIARAQEKNAKTKEEIALLKQKLDTVEVQTDEVKKEMVQLEIAMKELDVAIQEKKSEWSSLLLQIGIVVACMAISWGLSEVFHAVGQVAVQIGKTASGVTTYGVGVSF